MIGYYSRRLNKHERHYTVTEIELLAAVESIKHWRPYLWGREFKLVIDHSALRWLHTMRDTMEGGPASRLMRWILKLSEYNFTVEHKPGVAHKDADGVSRLAAAAGPTLFGTNDPYHHDLPSMAAASTASVSRSRPLSPSSWAITVVLPMMALADSECATPTAPTAAPLAAPLAAAPPAAMS